MENYIYMFWSFCGDWIQWSLLELSATSSARVEPKWPWWWKPRWSSKRRFYRDAWRSW